MLVLVMAKAGVVAYEPVLPGRYRAVKLSLMPFLKTALPCELKKRRIFEVFV